MSLINKLFIFGAILGNLSPTSANPRPCPKPLDCQNPCLLGAQCPAYPNAQCRPHYCNSRCEARFYVDDFRVSCELGTPGTPAPGIIYQKVCPAILPNEPGTCANMCFDCEMQGKICCPNACGKVCKFPTLVPVPSTTRAPPTPRPPLIPACPQVVSNGFGICMSFCNDCESRGQMCCPNGACGRVCMAPIWIIPPDQALPPPPPASDNAAPQPSVIQTLLSLTPSTPASVRGNCPVLPVEAAGLCIEVPNCEATCARQGKLCCSNGCGRACYDPVQG